MAGTQSIREQSNRLQVTSCVDDQNTVTTTCQVLGAESVDSAMAPHLSYRA